MRITELLDKRSILLDGTPKSKTEALDQVVELMVKSGKIRKHTAGRYMQEKRKVLPVLGKELRFLMENVMP